MDYGIDSIDFIAALAMCRLRNCVWMQEQIGQEPERREQQTDDSHTSPSKNQRHALMKLR